MALAHIRRNGYPQVDRAAVEMSPIGKLAEKCRANEEKAWEARIMGSMKRMTEDEPYRQEIAQKLS
jgi:hypothetical protein